MKENDVITIVVVTPWAIAEEVGIINKIVDDKIYINGIDIPFNIKTGYKTETFPGCSVYIKEITNIF